MGESTNRRATLRTWIDGFLLHYFLTGDPRSLQTANMVADRYDGRYARNYEFTNGRNNGWHLILTMAMYNATGDRFYLNAAHIIIERTLERQSEDGGWRRMLVPAHCRCDPPRHMGNAGFMVGPARRAQVLSPSDGRSASCRVDPPRRDVPRTRHVG